MTQAILDIWKPCKPIGNKINKAPGKVTRWIIDGVCYMSSCQAAKHLHTYEALIRNWCKGYVDHKRRVFYPPKSGCYTVTINRPLTHNQKEVVKVFMRRPEYAYKIHEIIPHIPKQAIVSTIKVLSDARRELQILEKISNKRPAKYRITKQAKEYLKELNIKPM